MQCPHDLAITPPTIHLKHQGQHLEILVEIEVMKNFNLATITGHPLFSVIQTHKLHIKNLLEAVPSMTSTPTPLIAPVLFAR